MAKANTPASSEEEKKTSPKSETTPEKKPDTLAEKPAEEPTPSDKRVKELEGEVERLGNELTKRDAITKTAQKQTRIEKIERKKLDKELKRIQLGEDYIPPEEPEGENQQEREVRLKARIGIQGLILDNPDYQELIKQDVTLKEVLRNNPFALVGEYLDAEDAVEQIKEKLDERVSSLKIQKEKNQPKEDTEEGKGGEKFEVGPTQPGEGKPETPASEPSPISPEDKVEESIKSRVKFT